MKDARDNKATENQAYQVLRLAQIHAEATTLPMKTSAKHCAKEAEEFFNKGLFGYCHEWACESLKYSVGILYPEYIRARALA